MYTFNMKSVTVGSQPNNFHTETVSLKTWEQLINTAVQDIRRLDYVYRYTTIPIVVQESTSTHSYWVAIYSIMIHFHIHPDDKDIGCLLLNALIHDLPECISSDVVRTFKYSTPELKQEIDRAEKLLLSKFPYNINFLFQFCQDNKNKYIEAVTKAADFLSLFQYIRREIMRNNMEIYPFYIKMISDISSKTSGEIINKFNVKEFYEALLNESKRLETCFNNIEFLKQGMQIT